MHKTTRMLKNNRPVSALILALAVAAGGIPAPSFADDPVVDTAGLIDEQALGDDVAVTDGMDADTATIDRGADVDAGPIDEVVLESPDTEFAEILPDGEIIELPAVSEDIGVDVDDRIVDSGEVIEFGDCGEACMFYTTGMPDEGQGGIEPNLAEDLSDLTAFGASADFVEASPTEALDGSFTLGDEPVVDIARSPAPAAPHIIRGGHLQP